MFKPACGAGRRVACLVGATAVVAALLAQTPASLAAADDYRLAVGDIVSFDFVDDTLPAEQLAVSSDGNISVPLLGSFSVAGLTVPEALQAMRAVFIERQIFIEPQISMAVSSFRPIFVLGDVKAPGSFPFQPLLTVEQAVALAGGQSTGGATAEDRVVTRARLRGNLEETAVEIAREAVAAARLTAQLADRAEISVDDMPPKTRGLANNALIEALLVTERQILSAEQRAFKSRRDQLTAAVKEVEGALANLHELARKQEEMIASARAELERARTLNKRGLKSLTELSGVERDASAQESHLLEVFNQMSTARRELGELQRQLAELTDTRTRTALTTLQQHFAETERLIASRSSIEEQILLLGSLEAQEAREASSIVFTYKIRRKVDGRVVTQAAGLDDPVFSGDTLLVAIGHEAGAAGGSLSSLAFGQAP